MTTAPTPALLPCPFCGAGNTEIRENGKVWSGMGYTRPTSTSVFHHCTPTAGQPSRAIERVGRDRASAIAAWNQRAKLEARKPLPLNDAEIIAAQESLARSRARIGLPCSRCESGKYRADSNAYHDFHRCDSCLHVPMWGEDGKEIGPPTCAGESS